MYYKSRGMPILGCQLENGKGNFGIYAKNVDAMHLVIYSDEKQTTVVTRAILTRDQWTTGDIFHVEITAMKEGYAYTWQTERDGVLSEQSLLDPYAYCMVEVPFQSKHYISVMIEKKLPIAKKPCIPWEQTVLYELHVGSFTKHPNSGVPDKLRGTFLGIKEKLPYLKELGITSIELLPIFQWNRHTLKTYHPNTKELLQDIWGYNTIGFFSPDSSYSTQESALSAVVEFRALVEACHENEIEVILDVVYNHTGEGDENGCILHFKALAKEIYYRFGIDGSYHNASGTGNTIRAAHQVVAQLVLDSLRYWVIYYGIDGFRFDLASILGQDDHGHWIEDSLLKRIAQDPILSNVKLISESWDAVGAYDVGRTPYPFKDWSDHFRDTMRRFVRGEQGVVQEVAQCISGEEVMARGWHRARERNIHFITAHDGFTMWDLSSYASKHNEANGEYNRDGTNQNYSDNFGIEGESAQPEIFANRLKRVKNYLSMLFLSRGVPMLLMGDECGRTQKGNNNAYCQDNLITWLDWDRSMLFTELHTFTQALIHFKKESGYMNDDRQMPAIIWHGVRCYTPDWSYSSRTLAWEIVGETKSFYVVCNQYWEALLFQLPTSKKGWSKRIDTSDINTQPLSNLLEDSYTVAAYSVCIFETNR